MNGQGQERAGQEAVSEHGAVIGEKQAQFRHDYLAKVPVLLNSPTRTPMVVWINGQYMLI